MKKKIKGNNKDASSGLSLFWGLFRFLWTARIHREEKDGTLMRSIFAFHFFITENKTDGAVSIAKTD